MRMRDCAAAVSAEAVTPQWKVETTTIAEGESTRPRFPREVPAGDLSAFPIPPDKLTPDDETEFECRWTSSVVSRKRCGSEPRTVRAGETGSLCVRSRGGSRITALSATLTTTQAPPAC